MIDETINEQNRASHRPCYDRAEKCWRVTFPDRDAEEGDLLYVASEVKAHEIARYTKLCEDLGLAD